MTPKTAAKQERGAGARPAPRGKRTAPKSEELFVGIDLHKVFLQAAVIDSEGNLPLNKRVANTFDAIRKEFSQYPKGAKYSGVKKSLQSVLRGWFLQRPCSSGSCRESFWPRRSSRPTFRNVCT